MRTITLLAAILCACAPGPRASLMAPPSTLTVIFENHSRLDYRGYACIASACRPATRGYVTAYSGEEWADVQYSVAGVELYIEVDYIAGGKWRSERIFWAEPGGCVLVEIESMESMNVVRPCD